MTYSKSSKREKEVFKIQQESEGLIQNPTRERRRYSKSNKRERRRYSKSSKRERRRYSKSSNTRRSLALRRRLTGSDD